VGPVVNPFEIVFPILVFMDFVKDNDGLRVVAPFKRLENERLFDQADAVRWNVPVGITRLACSSAIICANVVLPLWRRPAMKTIAFSVLSSCQAFL
jgi:hypothetical protein